MIIALCGMDGSGKSTLAAALKEEVEKRGNSAVVVQPYRYYLLTPFLNVVKNIKGRKTEQITRAGNPLLLKKNKNFLFTFWPLLALVDHWVYFLIKIKPLNCKYDYIICDRFYYDFAAAFRYFGYTNPLVQKIYLALLPPANQVFVLDLPAEKAKKREQGDIHSLDFFKIQRDYYLKLKKQFGLFMIDTSTEGSAALKRVFSYFNSI